MERKKEYLKVILCYWKQLHLIANILNRIFKNLERNKNRYCPIHNLTMSRKLVDHGCDLNWKPKHSAVSNPWNQFTTRVMKRETARKAESVGRRFSTCSSAANDRNWSWKLRQKTHRFQTKNPTSESQLTCQPHNLANLVFELLPRCQPPQLKNLSYLSFN